jgi:hypothetical protein
MVFSKNWHIAITLLALAVFPPLATAAATQSSKNLSAKSLEVQIYMVLAFVTAFTSNGLQ